MDAQKGVARDRDLQIGSLDDPGLEPLLEDVLNPSGPLDPDVIGAAVFALLVFVFPLDPRRTRGI